MGMGISCMSMDLTGTPKSFVNISNSYSNPYPRATILFLNPSFMFEYRPLLKRKALFSFFYCITGYKRFLNHRWQYGEISSGNSSIVYDGGSFSGLPVNMPNFLKSNLFFTVGLGLGF